MLGDKTKWQGDGPCYPDMRRETAPRCQHQGFETRSGAFSFSQQNRCQEYESSKIRRDKDSCGRLRLPYRASCMVCRARGTRIALLELSDDGVWALYCGAVVELAFPSDIGYVVFEVVPLERGGVGGLRRREFGNVPRGPSCHISAMAQGIPPM